MAEVVDLRKVNIQHYAEGELDTGGHTIRLGCQSPPALPFGLRFAETRRSAPFNIQRKYAPSAVIRGGRR